MRIYTRTGDSGETGLFSGTRVSKDAARVEAYGTVDEANSFIGLLRAERLDADVDAVLERVQHDLFALGADLATPADGKRADAVPRITADNVASLERAIDEFDKELPQLRSFILPAGNRAVALAHTARSVVRRAERRTVTLARTENISQETIRYLNRLSDLLFVLARLIAHRAGANEQPWQPK